MVRPGSIGIAHTLLYHYPSLMSPAVPQVFWEDANVGYCMRFLGIEPLQAKDEKGRERFHFQSPVRVSRLCNDTTSEAGACVAPDSVSFHYISSRQDMRRIYSLLHLCPGRDHQQQQADIELSSEVCNS